MIDPTKLDKLKEISESSGSNVSQLVRDSLDLLFFTDNKIVLKLTDQEMEIAQLLEQHLGLGLNDLIHFLFLDWGKKIIPDLFEAGG